MTGFVNESDFFLLQEQQCQTGARDAQVPAGQNGIKDQISQARKQTELSLLSDLQISLIAPSRDRSVSPNIQEESRLGANPSPRSQCALPPPPLSV